MELESTSCYPVNELQNNEEMQEHAVSWIVCNVAAKSGLRKISGWYEYSSEEDAFEPPEHLVEHFVDAYGC